MDYTVAQDGWMEDGDANGAQARGHGRGGKTASGTRRNRDVAIWTDGHMEFWTKQRKLCFKRMRCADTTGWPYQADCDTHRKHRVVDPVASEEHRGVARGEARVPLEVVDRGFHVRRELEAVRVPPAERQRRVRQRRRDLPAQVVVELWDRRGEGAQDTIGAHDGAISPAAEARRKRRVVRQQQQERAFGGGAALRAERDPGRLGRRVVEGHVQHGRAHASSSITF